ncbi:MAG: DsbC family protein [Gammaproteobacteria bacterium]|nr:DsbC family protein [Gammaproteobacteria bacterium]
MQSLFKWIPAATFGILLLGCDSANTADTATEKSTSANLSGGNSETVSTEKTEEELVESIKKTIQEQLGNVPIDRVQKSKLPNFYEVVAGGQIIYISKQQDFLFPGPLLAIEEGQLANLTKETLHKIDLEKAPERKALIDAIKESEMVVFKSPEERYVVNVFTDVDCAYCRKLHQNMDGYLEKGITVRYLAFPRAGVGSGAYNKLVSVWCSENPQQAMDNAKLNNQFESISCEENPIAAQYGLTRQMGLSGTPAIILSDGDLISGFLEPDKLADYLSKKDS